MLSTCPSALLPVSSARPHAIVLQLAGMGVAELPCELFLVTTLKQLRLFNNHLCALPSTVAQLSLLELLNVRANRHDLHIL